MSRKISPFKLGLFILICGAIGLIALIWLGTARFFEERKTYVSYFSESVKGLSQDAIVNYRGVGVGRVGSIGLAPDGRLIEVKMKLRPDFEVDQYLAIRLREQGLTGLRYLEIDTAPDNLDDLTPSIDFPVDYPVIPSYPSEIQELKYAFENLYSKIIEVDLQGLTDRWKETAERVNQVMAQADFGDTFENLRSGSAELESFFTKVNRSVDEKTLEETIAALRKSAIQAAALMEQLSGEDPGGEFKQVFANLNSTLATTRKTLEALAPQFQQLPEGAFATTSKNLNRMLGTMDESFGLLRQNLQQIRLLMNQLTSLLRSLEERPSRLLYDPTQPDPFERR